MANAYPRSSRDDFVRVSSKREAAIDQIARDLGISGGGAGGGASKNRTYDLVIISDAL